MLRNRDYVYREKENSEILIKSKPRELSRIEIVMRWEIIRKIMKGKRRIKRKIGRLYQRNLDIMGLYYEENGVIRRKSRNRVKGLGRKRENSIDSRIEYRDLKFYTKKGVRTRRMWLSEEPLPTRERNLLNKKVRGPHK